MPDLKFAEISLAKTQSAIKDIFLFKRCVIVNHQEFVHLKHLPILYL